MTESELSTMLDEVREYIIEELIPLEPQLLNQGFAAVEPTLHEKRKAIKDRGWWLPQMTKEIGGMGLSVHQFGQMSEILALTPTGHFTFGAQAPDAGNMEILHEFGTAEQKEKWLHPLANGDIRSCFSMTEPHTAGSNPTKLATTAVKEGDSWIIDGHKWFTSSYEGSAFAIAMVVTNPYAESPYERASMIIVPSDSEGLEHVRKISIFGDEGSSHSSHSELKYNSVRVPMENLLGEDGGGFKIAQQRLGPGRIHHCMRFVGMAERSLSMMCERAITREIGPDRMLASRQTIQNWIAESRAEINAARLLVLDAAHKIDTLGVKGARTAVSAIKFYTANVFMKVVDRAIQVHGALGITNDTVLSFYYAHERGSRIYDGADEVHKVVVARHELRKYGYKLRR